MKMAGTSEKAKENEEECGEACTINAGVGVALRICKLADIKCEDIQTELFEGKITVQEALDNIKQRLGEDRFHVGLVEEVEKIMKDRLEKTTACVSVYVKQQMNKEIDGWIEDRKEALETAPADGKFAEGTSQLIKNLEESKKAIENLPVCESE